MSYDEDACYETSLDIPSGKFGKLIAVPGGPGPSGPPGPAGPAGPAGPPGPDEGVEFTENKGQPDGYAPLDADGVVPAEHLPPLPMVDITQHPDVVPLRWTTFLGASFSAGQSTISGVPFTADDVGKDVIVTLPSTPANSKFWATKIVSVAGGVATVDSAAPEAVTNGRIRYGFDATGPLQAVLDEISARVDGAAEVVLGGNFRLRQLEIPWNVVLVGAPSRGAATVGAFAEVSKPILRQLPGAECDLIRWEDNPNIAGTVFSSGMIGFDLHGPEFGVVGKTATVGNGVNFRSVSGSYLIPIDGFRFGKVSAYNFPESGFRTHGAIPFYFENCKAVYNGRYGFEHVKFGGYSTNALTITNFSADSNNLGMILVRGTGPNDTVFIDGIKSEGNEPGNDVDNTRGGPNFQDECIVFENCDNTVAVIDGVSHIRVGRAGTGPGPSITVRDTQGQGRRPRITFSGVLTRVSGSETGSIADAVTLRDTVVNVDVPRSVLSGQWPSAVAGPLTDVAGTPVTFEKMFSGGTAFTARADATKFGFGDEGLAVRAAGVSPTISDGLFHDPGVTGAAGAQSSMWLQTLTNVDYLSASFKFSGASASAVMGIFETVLPTPFRQPNSPAFLSITSTGWQFGIYQGGTSTTNATLVNLAAGTFTTPLATDWNPAVAGSGTTHTASVRIVGSTAIISLPDGRRATNVTDARIGATGRVQANFQLYRGSTSAGQVAFSDIRFGVRKALPSPTLYGPVIDTVRSSNGREVLEIVPMDNSTAHFQMYAVPSGGVPILGVADSTQTNVGVALVPKGASAVQIGGTAPRIQATGPGTPGDYNLNLTGKGATGVVQANGVQVEIKGHTHVAGDVAGAVSMANTPTSATSPGTAGQISYNATHLFVCTATNTWQWVKLNNTWPPV